MEKDNTIIINSITAIVDAMKSVMIGKEIFINHEYMENIGTIYKGSNEESNKLLLRFKERFKLKFDFAHNSVLENVGR